MLLTMKAHIEALRGIAYLTAEGIDLATAHPDPAVRATAQERTDILTPIIKGWGTDLGVELTSIAVQVHGGLGYLRTTPVERFYRDARLFRIYEGTSQVQQVIIAKALLGDVART
jgi:acyl-CoA dehydrogenase